MLDADEVSESPEVLGQENQDLPKQQNIVQVVVIRVENVRKVDFVRDLFGSELTNKITLPKPHLSEVDLLVKLSVETDHQTLLKVLAEQIRKDLELDTQVETVEQLQVDRNLQVEQLEEVLLQRLAVFGVDGVSNLVDLADSLADYLAVVVFCALEQGAVLEHVRQVEQNRLF